MKKSLLLIAVLGSYSTFSQDSNRVEPMKTSTNNYDLLLIAAVGLIVLIGLYFLFRRTRKK